RTKEQHMKTNKARFFPLVLGSVLLVVGLGLAQAPAGPPKPGPEHQKLAYFAGKWTNEGDMKPSALGPGGKFSSSSTCEWFDGNFALVCHTDGATQTGSMKGLSIMGWDPAAKTYTYFSTNSSGQGGFSRGTVKGDTWTWNNETTMNGKPMVVRFTLKQVSPDVATYKFEMGAPGEPLKLMMDGKQTRVTLASN
ncbi:MAG TPA: DUF1579 family protein, partial [Candidatus Angelobacter sp.]|nr:DUF1579 family protein [Candidatus Angelobacter sp.]